MNIVFCDKCGRRISEADVSAGTLTVTGEGQHLCSGCVPVPAASGATSATLPKSPSSGRARREGMTHQTTQTRAHPQPTAMRTKASPVPLIGGMAALVLLAVVAVLMNSGRDRPSGKAGPAKTSTPPMPPVATGTAVQATPPTSSTPPTPPTLPTPPVEPDRKTPGNEESPRDTIARNELDAIKAFGREHPDDLRGYGERLSGFISRHRTTTSGPEAVRLLADLDLPSRVDHPLARWTFDEGSGRSARDSAGSNTATLNGDVRFVAGRVGSGAVAFAGGREDYVDLGSNPALNFKAGAPFTIAGWFKTSAAFAVLVSFRKSSDDTPDLDIAIGHHGGAKAPGRLMAIVRQDGSINHHGDVLGKAVNDGAWHHFALTRNTKGTIRLFRDGRFQGMHTAAASGGAITTDVRTCGLELRWTRVAKPPDPTGQGLKGEMDDLRVYDCELTETEIDALIDAK